MHLNAGNLKPVPGGETIAAELAPAARYAVTIAFAGIAAEVRFSQPEVAARYRRRYRHLHSARPAQLVAYAVARRPDEIYFWSPGNPVCVWDHSALNAAGVAFLADAVSSTAFLGSVDGLIALHAAAVSDGVAVAAILGQSATGKTTTAIACARRGLELYSDEFCIIGPNGVVPFPRALNLRAGGIELLTVDAAPFSHVDRWLRVGGPVDREDVGYDEIFGGLPAGSPRPLAAVFAVSARGPRAVARPISPGRMLPHAAAWAKMKPRGVHAVRRLLEQLQGVACYDLVLGRPDETAQLIARTLAVAGARRRSPLEVGPG